MGTRHRIEIIATDGQRNVRLMFFEMGTDLYYGPIFKGMTGHYTYHASGKRHFKMVEEGGEKELIPMQWPRLADVKGMPQLIGFYGIKDLNELPAMPYKGERIDDVIWIDTRAIGDGFQVNVCLLEPGRTDLLTEIVDIFPGCSIHISTATTPWLVVQVGKGPTK